MRCEWSGTFAVLGPGNSLELSDILGPGGVGGNRPLALTGEGSVWPGVPAKQNSWATGDSPGLGSEFHDDVGAALKEISERSPHSKVLLVTQVGRPIRNAQMRMKSGHVTPFGAGECDFFDANGRYVPKKAAHLTDIIVGYEKAQARACKAVPNCWTDNGTGSSFREEWAYFEGADNVHMNTTGLSKLAEHMWPAVEAVLRAPTQ